MARSGYFVNGQCVEAASDKDSYYLKGLYGFGDNLYQRAWYRGFTEPTWIDTPFPELYADLPLVKCVPPRTTLHTQVRHMARGDQRWSTLPYEVKTRFIGYDNYDLEVYPPYSIPGALKRRLAMHLPTDFKPIYDLPPLPPSRHPGCAVIRPGTLRREWLSPARACDPIYLAQAAATLRARGHVVVSIAGCAQGQEWHDGEPPDVDYRYDFGELSIMESLALVAQAKVVVAGTGWIVPAVYSARVPAALIAGGYLGHNSPHQLTDATMDQSRVQWFMPDNPCLCIDMQHKCDKTITGFEGKFTAWLNQRDL